MTLLDRAADTARKQDVLQQHEAKMSELARIGAQALAQQQRAQYDAHIENAHTAGVDDGINAALRRLQAQQAEQYYAKVPSDYTPSTRISSGYPPDGGLAERMYIQQQTMV